MGRTHDERLRALAEAGDMVTVSTQKHKARLQALMMSGDEMVMASAERHASSLEYIEVLHAAVEMVDYAARTKQPLMHDAWRREVGRLMREEG